MFFIYKIKANSDTRCFSESMSTQAAMAVNGDDVFVFYVFFI